MPEQIRVAMIGAGSMANSVHYPSLASFPDVEIAAICDLNEDRLNNTADKYGISRRFLSTSFDSYCKMLDEVKPDAVYAIGQPNIMYPIWKHCLESGFNLCIEKPMGITLHQARSLAFSCRKSTAVLLRSAFSAEPAQWLFSFMRRCALSRPNKPCSLRVL